VASGVTITGTFRANWANFEFVLGVFALLRWFPVYRLEIASQSFRTHFAHGGAGHSWLALLFGGLFAARCSAARRWERSHIWLFPLDSAIRPAADLDLMADWLRIGSAARESATVCGGRAKRLVLLELEIELYFQPA
jgi:hypothetical protein